MESYSIALRQNVIVCCRRHWSGDCKWSSGDALLNLQEIRQDIRELRSEASDFHEEVHTEFSDMRKDMVQQLGELRQDIRQISGAVLVVSGR
jgi:hypothetical protein